MSAGEFQTVKQIKALLFWWLCLTSDKSYWCELRKVLARRFPALIYILKTEILFSRSSSKQSTRSIKAPGQNYINPLIVLRGSGSLPGQLVPPAPARARIFPNTEKMSHRHLPNSTYRATLGTNVDGGTALVRYANTASTSALRINASLYPRASITT